MDFDTIVAELASLNRDERIARIRAGWRVPYRQRFVEYVTGQVNYGRRLLQPGTEEYGFWENVPAPLREVLITQGQLRHRQFEAVYESLATVSQHQQMATHRSTLHPVIHTNSTETQEQVNQRYYEEDMAHDRQLHENQLDQIDYDRQLNDIQYDHQQYLDTSPSYDSYDY